MLNNGHKPKLKAIYGLYILKIVAILLIGIALIVILKAKNSSLLASLRRQKVMHDELKDIRQTLKKRLQKDGKNDI